MRSKSFLSVAALGFSALFAAHAHAGLNPANHSEWIEDYYYNGFGGPAPAGLQEVSVGFATIGDYDGRVLANAAQVLNTIDSAPLTTITTHLFSGTDVNLYHFAISSPSTFTANLSVVASTGPMLALFANDGTAIALSIGNTQFTAANTGITTAGQYYIGIADANMFPSNTAGQNIFGVSSSSPAGIYLPTALSDIKLSTLAYNAWTLPGGQYQSLLTNTSFTAGNSTIALVGATGAPEPASLGLLGVGAVSVLARRRSNKR